MRDLDLCSLPLEFCFFNFYSSMQHLELKSFVLIPIPGSQELNSESFGRIPLHIGSKYSLFFHEIHLSPHYLLKLLLLV